MSRDVIAAEAVGMLRGLVEQGLIPAFCRPQAESLLTRHDAAVAADKATQETIRHLSEQRKRERAA